MDGERDWGRELHEGLTELSQQVSRAKQRGDDPNEVQQQMDMFDIEWQDKLFNAEMSELTGSRKAIRIAVAEQDRQAQIQQETKDSARLGSMNETDRDAFWHSAVRGRSSAIQVHEQSKRADALFEIAHKEIQSEFGALRDGMVGAVQDIMDGREPDLSFTHQGQTEQGHTQQGHTEARQIAPERQNLRTSDASGIEQDVEAVMSRLREGRERD